MIESTFAFFGAIIALLIFYGVLAKIRIFSLVGFALLLIFGLYVLTDGIQLSIGETKTTQEIQTTTGNFSVTYNYTTNFTTNITNNITIYNNTVTNITQNVTCSDNSLVCVKTTEGTNISVNYSNLPSSATGWGNNSTTTQTNFSVKIGNMSISENSTNFIINIGNKNLTFTDTSDPSFVVSTDDSVYLPTTKCSATQILTADSLTGKVKCANISSLTTDVAYYGGMFNSTSGSITLTLKSVWYNISDFEAGELNGWWFNKTSQELVCNNSGVYHVSYSLSGKEASVDDCFFQLTINGIADNKSLTKQSQTVGYFETISFAYLRRFSIGDAIKFQLSDNTAAGKVFTLENRNVNVFKVGN